jgi:hypothetical protein
LHFLPCSGELVRSDIITSIVILVLVAVEVEGVLFISRRSGNKEVFLVLWCLLLACELLNVERLLLAAFSFLLAAALFLKVRLSETNFNELRILLAPSGLVKFDALISLEASDLSKREP